MLKLSQETVDSVWHIEHTATPLSLSWLPLMKKCVTYTHTWKSKVWAATLLIGGRGRSGGGWLGDGGGGAWRSLACRQGLRARGRTRPKWEHPFSARLLESLLRAETWRDPWNFYCSKYFNAKLKILSHNSSPRAEEQTLDHVLFALERGAQGEMVKSKENAHTQCFCTHQGFVPAPSGRPHPDTRCERRMGLWTAQTRSPCASKFLKAKVDNLFRLIINNH